MQRISHIGIHISTSTIFTLLKGQKKSANVKPSSVSATEFGAYALVSQYPEFRELCIIPLLAGTNSVGAILFTMSDCNPSMLERMQDILGRLGQWRVRFCRFTRLSDSGIGNSIFRLCWNTRLRVYVKFPIAVRNSKCSRT